MIVDASIEAREAALHEAAIEQTGYSDFGDTDYLEGLRLILKELNEQPDNVKLAAAVERNAMYGLVGRLHSQAGWTANPSCLDDPLVAPLIVTGMPRTGTSMLHQILSTDAQFQWMPHWIAVAPQPRPPQEEWENYRDYVAADKRLNEQFHANPLVRAAHNSEAGLPEECICVLLQSFVSMRFVSTLPLPRYEKWFFEQDETPSYRRFADNLRLMANGCRRPWLLKNPSHIIGIDALLDVFPNARVVVTHRNPVDSISSGASVIRRSAGEMWHDQKAIGPHRLRVWSRGAERLERARSRRPEQFVEVGYDDLLDDPVRATEKIYARFGLKRTPQTVTAMQNWVEANPQGKHGQHVYSMEATGLSAEAISAALVHYNDRYGYSK